MAFKLPPQPVGVAPGHAYWNDWYEKLRTAFNSGQVATTWANIDFSGSNITDIVNRSHENLQSLQGGTGGEHFHFTSAQHTDLTDGGDSTLHFHASDRARANHTGTQTMSTISDLPTLASGTFTPTLTNVTNVAASTAFQCQYLRIGSVVTVSGKVDIDPTAASTLTQLGISLPVASNFANSEDCAGTAAVSAVASMSGNIQADATNNRAELQFIHSDTANRSWFFTFSYEVI